MQPNTLLRHQAYRQMIPQLQPQENHILVVPPVYVYWPDQFGYNNTYCLPASYMNALMMSNCNDASVQPNIPLLHEVCQPMIPNPVLQPRSYWQLVPPLPPLSVSPVNSSKTGQNIDNNTRLLAANVGNDEQTAIFIEKFCDSRGLKKEKQKYSEAFRKNAINGFSLSMMTPEIMKDEIGITNDKHIDMFITEFSRLNCCIEAHVSMEAASKLWPKREHNISMVGESGSGDKMSISDPRGGTYIAHGSSMQCSTEKGSTSIAHVSSMQCSTEKIVVNEGPVEYRARTVDPDQPDQGKHPEKIVVDVGPVKYRARTVLVTFPDQPDQGKHPEKGIPDLQILVKRFPVFKDCLEIKREKYPSKWYVCVFANEKIRNEVYVKGKRNYEKTEEMEMVWEYKVAKNRGVRPSPKHPRKFKVLHPLFIRPGKSLKKDDVFGYLEDGLSVWVNQEKGRRVRIIMGGPDGEEMEEIGWVSRHSKTGEDFLQPLD